MKVQQSIRYGLLRTRHQRPPLTSWPDEWLDPSLDPVALIKLWLEGEGEIYGPPTSWIDELNKEMLWALIREEIRAVAMDSLSRSEESPLVVDLLASIKQAFPDRRDEWSSDARQLKSWVRTEAFRIASLHAFKDTDKPSFDPEAELESEIFEGDWGGADAQLREEVQDAEDQDLEVAFPLGVFPESDEDALGDDTGAFSALIDFEDLGEATPPAGDDIQEESPLPHQESPPISAKKAREARPDQDELKHLLGGRQRSLDPSEPLLQPSPADEAPPEPVTSGSAALPPLPPASAPPPPAAPIPLSPPSVSPAPKTTPQAIDTIQRTEEVASSPQYDQGEIDDVSHPRGEDDQGAKRVEAPQISLLLDEGLLKPGPLERLIERLRWLSWLLYQLIGFTALFVLHLIDNLWELVSGYISRVFSGFMHLRSMIRVNQRRAQDQLSIEFRRDMAGLLEQGAQLLCASHDQSHPLMSEYTSTLMRQNPLALALSVRARADDLRRDLSFLRSGGAKKSVRNAFFRALLNLIPNPISVFRPFVNVLLLSTWVRYRRDQINQGFNELEKIFTEIVLLIERMELSEDVDLELEAQLKKLAPQLDVFLVLTLQSRYHAQPWRWDLFDQIAECMQSRSTKELHPLSAMQLRLSLLSALAELPDPALSQDTWATLKTAQRVQKRLRVLRRNSLI